MQKRPHALLAATLIAALPVAAWSAEPVLQTDYTVALSGLPLARAQFTTAAKGSTYTVSATLATTGLAKFISDTRAKISIEGRAGAKAWTPERYAFGYRYGPRHRDFETIFKGGDVATASIDPKPDYSKRKNWVPTKPEDLKSVTDPVTALIVPTASEPCRSNVGVFDGEARMNLHLSPKRTDTFKTDGFSGDVTVCSIRYEPVSGHRARSKDVDYVKQLQNVEIWFAKSASMNVYAPVRLSVPTKFGVLSITATRFEG